MAAGGGVCVNDRDLYSGVNVTDRIVTWLLVGCLVWCGIVTYHVVTRKPAVPVVSPSRPVGVASPVYAKAPVLTYKSEGGTNTPWKHRDVSVTFFTNNLIFLPRVSAVREVDYGYAETTVGRFASWAGCSYRLLDMTPLGFVVAIFPGYAILKDAITGDYLMLVREGEGKEDREKGKLEKKLLMTTGEGEKGR